MVGCSVIESGGLFVGLHKYIFCNYLTNIKALVSYSLNMFADEHCIIAEEQRGFRKGKSCLNNIADANCWMQ